MEKFQAVPKILNMFYQDGQGDCSLTLLCKEENGKKKFLKHYLIIIVSKLTIFQAKTLEINRYPRVNFLFLD